jgi:hypothetical protein
MTTYKYDVGMLVETDQYGIDGCIIKGIIESRGMTSFSEIYYTIETKECSIPYKIYEYQIIKTINENDQNVCIEKLRMLINKQLDNTIENVNKMNKLIDQMLENNIKRI